MGRGTAGDSTQYTVLSEPVEKEDIDEEDLQIAELPEESTDFILNEDISATQDNAILLGSGLTITTIEQVTAREVVEQDCGF